MFNLKIGRWLTDGLGLKQNQISHNIAAWKFVPGMDEMGPFGSALNTSVFTWLGFYFPGDLGSTVWEKKSWKLFAINTGYHLASLVVVAFIITYWIW